jgi:hypothetical protein
MMHQNSFERKLSSSAKGTYHQRPQQHRVEHRHRHMGVQVTAPKDMDERHLQSTNQINQIQDRTHLSRAISSQERFINMVHQNSLKERRFSENLEKTKINPRKNENITSFCSGHDSKNCSKFHFFISKFCKGTSQKEKTRAVIHNPLNSTLEGSLSHPVAPSNKLNLSTHRATLSAFYPNVCSVEVQKHSKREEFVSSHPSTLSTFYSSIRDIEGKRVMREECSDNHLAHPPARVPQLVTKEKNPSQVIGLKKTDDYNIPPSVPIRINENAFQYRSNTGKGFAA